MQVFKAFLRILRKKLPIAMIWVVVFLMIAIGVTTNNSSPFSFTENQFNICVFDEDQTPESKNPIIVQSTDIPKIVPNFTRYR